MAEDQAQQIADLQRQLDAEVSARKRLVKIATALNSTFQLDELLQLIVQSATDLLDAETGSLLLMEEDSGDLIIRIAAGSTEADVVGSRVPTGQGIAGWTAEHREPVVVTDPASDERFYGEVDAATGFETTGMLAVPLIVKERCIGVLEVLNKLGPDSFDDDDVELANAFAGMAALALDNAAMYAKLADAVVTARMSYRL